MIGREAEWSHLVTAWEAARDGAGSVVLVSGVAGVGKSRLARELGAWVRSQGATVLSGRSSTTTDSPLRPIREALLGLARSGYRPAGAALEPFRAALGRLVPDWATSDIAELSPVVVGEGVLRVLDDLAARRAPVLFLVDDVQWADPDTAAVVEYLADNSDASHFLVVATVRDGEAGAGADAAARLVARRAANSLPLRPLGAGQVAQMVRTCLHTDAVSDELAAAIATRSDGIPFLVEELLATATSTQGPGSAPPGSVSPGSVAPGGMAVVQFEEALPDIVRSSVAARIATLPEPAARLLRVASMFGRAFDWGVAADAASVARADAPSLLRLAVQAQLVEVDGAGFRFRHELTRDAIRADLLPGERAASAKAALAALRRGADIEDRLAELAAALAIDAGDSDDAAALLTRAALGAMRDGSLASAEALAERARVLAGDHATARIEQLLLEIRAEAGRPEDVLRDGAGLLVSLGDDAPSQTDLAAVLMIMAKAALAAGHFDEVDRLIAACRGAVVGEQATVARLAALEAQSAMGRDDAVAALPLAYAALAAAESSAAPDVQCEALEVIGRAERVRDAAAGEAAFERAYDIAVGARLPLRRIHALQELGTIDLFQTLATDRLMRARAEATAAGALSTLAVIELQLAACHNERAEIDEALRAAHRCEELSRRLELSTLAMALTQQSFAHARAGLATEMEDAITAAIATGRDSANVDIGVWGNARATLHLCRGDLDAAGDALARSMDVLRRLPGAAFPFTGFWPLVLTVRDHVDQREARDEVRNLVADTPVSRHAVTAADAVVAGRSGDPVKAASLFAAADAGLERHQGHFRRDLVRVLVAPCAFADGWGDPVTWMRSSLVSTEAKELAGLAEQCRATLRRAGATVPRRSSAGAVPAPLAALGITAREVEVLTLLAAGESNRAIAARLFLSPRTVEKHVERVLTKAGTTRAGAAALAAAAGLVATDGPPRT
jgi:DNA-binding CsgD family transcriptional regulator